MKEFPTNFTPANKEKFSKYLYDRNLAYLRKEIYELVLKGDENKYFELDKFARTYDIDKTNMEKMTATIKNELESNKWKVKTSYGGTGLFIYSSEQPSCCYDDGF
jgi:hypothetical protein